MLYYYLIKAGVSRRILNLLGG